jgi:UDP-glucose 4-epimerase
MDEKWIDKSVCVTGGASFIGSHLVDDLVKLGAKVTVVDDLSSGRLDNLSESIQRVKFIKTDLEYVKLEELKEIFKDTDTVFHLAATHGGRGYIHLHPADVCSNFSIDHHVFEAACVSGVEKVVFASSACVYPPRLQNSFDSTYLLNEDDSNILKLEEPLSADIEYGWAKLMGEVQLNAFVKQYGLKGCSVRFVTAYGPRENETHAIIALIYKAFELMDPYVIWGTGEESRDFTYVSDITSGTILAAEKISNGTPVNLGTGRRCKLKDVADSIFEITGHRPKKIAFDASKPTGVVNRALNIEKARKLIGWEPKVTLEEGLRKTVNWYFSTHSRNGAVSEKLLLERAMSV